MIDSVVAILDRMYLDPGYVALARSLFPEADCPARIAQAVEAACRRALAADPVECFYVEMSVAAVFGLGLSDGRRIALKANLPALPRQYIEAAVSVQGFLGCRGFPCPRILRDPLHDGVRTVTFEEWSAPGSDREADAPEVRDAMAQALAQQVRDAALCPAHARLKPDPLPRGLWNTPHNVLFDFERTSAGAEWIDERARSARAILERLEGPLVPGHMDWTVRHLRFHPDGTVAIVYDWDSLRLAHEARVVGCAAATFTTRFDPTPTRTPEPLEAAAFVRSYEAGRGAPFTGEERRAVSAAALYATAYGARCEHALQDPAGLGMFGERLRHLSREGYFHE